MIRRSLIGLGLLAMAILAIAIAVLCIIPWTAPAPPAGSQGDIQGGSAAGAGAPAVAASQAQAVNRASRSDQQAQVHAALVAVAQQAAAAARSQRERTPTPPPPPPPPPPASEVESGSATPLRLAFADLPSVYAFSRVHGAVLIACEGRLPIGVTNEPYRIDIHACRPAVAKVQQYPLVGTKPWTADGQPRNPTLIAIVVPPNLSHLRGLVNVASDGSIQEHQP